ncbi:uncharacterized protein LOC109538757 [Dendroctonus ponderosae]|uniref:Uncharacterized protein n=2 Tax=Dendroctonus ponderosae TaxID=77166 RepID=A0AAR5PKX9_DENPD|nr:uncharacterized protein LOC109538757 [Dendroctonus ponderosae]KAH1000087.1 hypothetical protein HUJ04_000019 [Dendroctonus ponderosae]
MRPVLLLTGVLLAVSAANDPHSITKRSFYLLFPKGAVLQFTYGLTVPFVLPRRSINLTWGFQAQFNLPSSLSNFYPTTIDVRSNSYWFDLPRVKFYQYLSKLLDNFGLNGEQCVLRSCCEVAEIPMYDREDSVLEKIVQYLFTPSIELSLNASSESVQEPEDALTKKLLQAEELGKSQGGCDDQYSNCIMSIVDLMTVLYVT